MFSQGGHEKTWVVGVSVEFYAWIDDETPAQIGWGDARE